MRATTKIQQILKGNFKKGMQLQLSMAVKAEEMIEMLKLVKKDAKKRAWQYNMMIKAIDRGEMTYAKNLFEDMKTWKKYKM